MTTETTKIDARKIAERNERKVLRWLHRFGWLRAADVAALVWRGPGAAQMARRTLRRLAKSADVLTLKGPNGAPVYALAESGARRLSVDGIDAASGKDLVRDLGNFAHRCKCNEVAIGLIRSGARVYTEREILARRAPFHTVLKKVPDVLENDPQGMVWYEIENSYKKGSDFTRLVNFLVHLFPRHEAGADQHMPRMPGGDHLFLARVVFVCEPGFRRRVERELQRRLGPEAEPFIEDWLSFVPLDAA